MDIEEKEEDELGPEEKVPKVYKYVARRRLVKQNLAGIIPAYDGDSDMKHIPFSKVLLPVSKKLIAIERAVRECVNAGCRHIWIICDKSTTPIIRHRIGDVVQEEIIEPYRSEEQEQYKSTRAIGIPIFYVPQHPTDKMNNRINIPWQIIYGATRAYQITSSFTVFLATSKFYVTFPLSVHGLEPIKKIKSMIHQDENNLFLEICPPAGKPRTAKDGEIIGFSFNIDELQIMKNAYYEKEEEYKKALYFGSSKKQVKWKYSLQDILKDIEIKQMFSISYYTDITSWLGYLSYMKTNGDLHFKRKSVIFRDKFLSPIGQDYYKSPKK